MKSLQFISIVLMLTVLSSCESKTFLKSKKKLDKDLQGYWTPLPGTSIYGSITSGNDILWRFNDGHFYILQVNDKGEDVPVDNGLYAISAKIDNDYLTISDLNSPQYLSNGYNIKWDIIELSKNNLSIAGQPNNGGRIEIEFSRTQH